MQNKLEGHTTCHRVNNKMFKKQRGGVVVSPLIIFRAFLFPYNIQKEKRKYEK